MVDAWQEQGGHVRTAETLHVKLQLAQWKWSAKHNNKALNTTQNHTNMTAKLDFFLCFCNILLSFVICCCAFVIYYFLLLFVVVLCELLLCFCYLLLCFVISCCAFVINCFLLWFVLVFCRYVLVKLLLCCLICCCDLLFKGHRKLVMFNTHTLIVWLAANNHTQPIQTQPHRLTHAEQSRDTGAHLWIWCFMCFVFLLLFRSV